MTTYTVPWDDGRVAERAVGDRRDGEPRVWRGPSLPTFDEWSRDHQFDFFVEDLANGMAFAPTKSGDRVEYRQEEGDRELAARIAEAVAPDDLINGRWRQGRVHDSVRDWMRQAWYDTARYGHAVHEVAPLVSRNSEGSSSPPLGVALFRVDPREVGHRWGRWGGRLVHRTSRIDQRERGLPPSVPLDGPRFAVYTAPDRLGKTLRDTVSGLRNPALGSVLTVAPWSHPDLYRLGYSIRDHNAVRDVLLAQATRETGWYGRGQFNEHATGHYMVRRRLRERRFTARLRDSFLAHLNAALNGSSRRLGGQARIVAPDTYAAADYDEAERMLDSGDHTFREVWARVGE